MRVELISEAPKGILLRINTRELDYCNHMLMCIKQVGSSEYSAPDNLRLIVEEMLSGVYALSPHMYNNDSNYNCYLSVKHEYVNGGSVGNRPDWHIDGFKSDQRNFIWFDSIPTEVCAGRFHLTYDHDTSLDEMTKQASGDDKVLHKLPIQTVYEMDQECVHRPTYNKTDRAVLRTFIKLTFSKEVFNGFGNAWNYKLPHIQPTAPRKEIRNHGTL